MLSSLFKKGFDIQGHNLTVPNGTLWCAGSGEADKGAKEQRGGSPCVEFARRALNVMANVNMHGVHLTKEEEKEFREIFNLVDRDGGLREREC